MYSKPYIFPVLEIMNSFPVVPEIFPREGDTLGRNKILGVRGEGAAGRVYKARGLDIESIRGVKICRAQADSPEGKVYVQAAKLAARFDSPNLVRIYSVDLWNSQLPCMEMEFVDGQSVEELLKKHTRFPLDVALSIVALSCRGLTHIQEKRFSANEGPLLNNPAHLNIKPSNILVSKAGEVKVSDFGLHSLGRTNNDMVLGAWVYYSPEQHTNSPADFRSDIYSLGLSLYEMLAGARPFSEGNPLEMGQSKDKEFFIPIRTRIADIPEFVEYILSKCLSADPQKRYRSYHSLLEAAQKALGEITARTPDTIVQNWVAAPERYQPLRVSLKKPGTIGRPAIIAGLCVLITTLSIFGIFLMAKAKTPPTHVSGPDANSGSAAVAAFPSPLAPKVASQNAIKNVSADSAPAAPNKEQSQSRRAAASIASDEKPMKKSLPEETALTKAFAQFNNRNYARVIELITMNSLQYEKEQAGDSAFLLLLGSYYMSSREKPQNFKNALDMLESRKGMNDAYYFLCSALACQTLGKNGDAEEAFSRALSAGSIMGRDIARTVSYQRAQFYKRIFNKEQSADNRRKMLDAWNDFFNKHCGVADAWCEDARRIIEAN
jgi:serine/threonine protein kinase